MSLFQDKIEGFQVTPLKEIADKRGSVLHMLKCDSPDFVKFGECYFAACAFSSHVKGGMDVA